MASIFTKIANREIPCHFIAETDEYFAFLDINPVALGHTLVIPKREVDYYFDLENNMYGGIWVFAKKIAKAIERTVPCVRIGVTILGLEVPHAHIHLVPLDDKGIINFKNKVDITDEALAQLAAEIRKKLA